MQGKHDITLVELESAEAVVVLLLLCLLLVLPSGGTDNAPLRSYGNPETIEVLPPSGGRVNGAGVLERPDIEGGGARLASDRPVRLRGGGSRCGVREKSRGGPRESMARKQFLLFEKGLEDAKTRKRQLRELKHC